MSLVYTLPQLARARESLAFWRSKGCATAALWQLLGCEGGETSFIWKIAASGEEFTPPGDHGQARGIFQWWPARGDKIKAESGHDVRFGTHKESLAGAFEEMTAHWSAYRAVWPALQAARSGWAAQTELVRYYEQSRDQEADVVKRVGIAAYLEHILS